MCYQEGSGEHVIITANLRNVYLITWFQARFSREEMIVRMYSNWTTYSSCCQFQKNITSRSDKERLQEATSCDTSDASSKVPDHMLHPELLYNAENNYTVAPNILKVIQNHKDWMCTSCTHLLSWNLSMFQPQTQRFMTILIMARV